MPGLGWPLRSDADADGHSARRTRGLKPLGWFAGVRDRRVLCESPWALTLGIAATLIAYSLVYTSGLWLRMRELSPGPAAGP